MRLFSIALALFCLIVPAFAGESFRVATCEVDGLETPLPEIGTTEEDLRPLRQLASSLKPLDAEILVLHGLPDRQSAKRLAGFLKPIYQVAFHGVFRKNGGNTPIVGPSITVLTRKPPYVARAMDWRATGQIDWPGGFAFVGIHSGTNTLCLYVAHLPGEPADWSERENPLLARRRDLAAQYLVHHANWVTTSLSNQLVSAVMTGDFITDAKGVRSEGAVRILQQAGFKLAAPSQPRSNPANLGDSGVAPPLLTGLLARNAELISTAQQATRKAPIHVVAAYEVAPVANYAPGGGSSLLTASSSSGHPVAAKVVALDRSIIWLWVGGILALSLASFVSVWLIRRTFSAAGILGRRSNPALVLDLGPASGRGEPFTFPRQSGESYSSSTADAATAAAVWQARAVQAEQRAKQTAAYLSETVRPHLSRWLRDRLVAWLSFQRAALMTSQEAGTKHVLELEARLEHVQGQFHDRLRTREERIAELEREILAKEKIIRDLLRAQVRMADENARERT